MRQLRCRYRLVTSLLLPAAFFGSMQVSEADAANSSQCPKSKNGLIGVTNSEKGFNFFLRKGLSPMHSAALIGNFLQESSMNPGITNSIGAHGIAQWLDSNRRLRKGRRSDLENYARKRNLRVDNLLTQLKFAWYELNSTNDFALEHLKRQTTLQAATLSVRVKYERPHWSEANDPRRLVLAKEVLARGQATGYCGLVKGVKGPKPRERQERRKNNGKEELIRPPLESGISLGGLLLAGAIGLFFAKALLIRNRRRG